MSDLGLRRVAAFLLEWKPSMKDWIICEPHGPGTEGAHWGALCWQAYYDDGRHLKDQLCKPWIK